MWQRFVAIGDSFTEGLMDRVGPDGRHRGWADRTACALQEREPSLLYANLAVRGRLLGQVIDEQVPAARRLQPDLVSVAAGVNDTLRRSFDLDEVMAKLERGVRDLREDGSDVLLFAFGDPSRRSRMMGSVSRRIARTNAATKAIAREHGCYLVDFWGCAVFDSDEYWDEDRLHLTPAGHALASQAALQALGLGDDTWRTPGPLGPPQSAVSRAIGHGRWAQRHLGPWVVRRLQGHSSGDDVVPKRPTLTPPDCPD